jgi:hypothetical protein
MIDDVSKTEQIILHKVLPHGPPAEVKSRGEMFAITTTIKPPYL